MSLRLGGSKLLSISILRKMRCGINRRYTSNTAICSEILPYAQPRRRTGDLLSHTGGTFTAQGVQINRRPSFHGPYDAQDYCDARAT